MSHVAGANGSLEAGRSRSSAIAGPSIREGLPRVDDARSRGGRRSPAAARRSPAARPAAGAEQRAEVLAIRDEYEQLWRDLIEAGRTAHGWAVPDTPVVSFAITTMCTAVDVWDRDGGRLTPDEIAEIYGEFVLEALTRDASTLR